jgi:lipopolysaccharide transport system ATP-binding protein
MSDVAIRAHKLGKQYRIDRWHGREDSLRDAMMSAVSAPLHALRGYAFRQPPQKFWALRDVSFEVRWGDVLGIVGRNGAGKSTLLKILSRVVRPTVGRAEIRGRVGSLLEVGTGFHDELTGRDNIYLNGAILGMKRAEIRRKFDEIVDFAEIGQFLDTPVKRYSSGMYMRLAFAVAAHLEQEILIVDEVLAVGDAAFQEKCLGKMRGIAKGSGRTVFFVSHNLEAVQRLCDRAILLSEGRIVFDGPVRETVRHYLDHMQTGASRHINENAQHGGSGAFRLTSICMRDERGNLRSDFVAGEPLTIDVGYMRNGRCRGMSLGVTIVNQLGIACTHMNTSDVGMDLDVVAERGHILCHISRNPFPVGEYSVSVIIGADDMAADDIPGCLSFQVIASRFFPSAKASECDLIYRPVMVDHQWQHRSE